jgi:hypothetical protein
MNRRDAGSAGSRSVRPADHCSGRSHNQIATVVMTVGMPMRPQIGAGVNWSMTALAIIASVANHFARRGTVPRSRQARM